MEKGTSETPLIPRELLFGNPDKAQPRLSPDGKRLSYIAPVNDILNVWVGSVGTGDFEPVTKDAKRGIHVHLWAEDGKHLLYLQDTDGDENWRIFAVEPDSKETRDLTPFEGVQAGILATSKHFPDEVLVMMNRRDPRLHDVFRLSVSTGELELVAENPGDFVGWLPDKDYEIRAAQRMTLDGGSELFVRGSESDEWEKLITWNAEDGLSSGPVGFSEDGERIHLLDSREANASRLVSLDLETGKTEVLAEDPDYDAAPFSLMIHPDTHEIQAVAFERARLEWTILDENIRGDFETIKSLNPGDFSIMSRDRADENWLAGFTRDKGGVSYYSYDRKKGEGTHLFDDRPELKEYELAEMKPVSFVSRDGLTIHGYLTLPPGAGSGPLPTVLNVHGGPWARDVWGYHPEAQWLANRGYACLQVNYRGSTGYGKKFLNAGNREWGARMHEDLVDAVEWAVGEGIADSDRVAIYGGSYGGYAALVGATFTPDLFRCAVDLVGPSSLVTLIESVPPYWEPMIAQFHERVGNPETEREFLESRSPLFKVDEMKIPMLIAQGANDPRVKQAESEQIVAAMKEKGIDHEYLLFEDEGHGFVRPENRLKFYAAAEDFLAKHLGGRAE
jgi:dipeptidyl aminopeptidase/acylaminoacyl peptidase